MEYKLAKQLKGAGFPQDIKIGVKYYSPIGHPRLGIPHQQAVTTSLIDHDDKINELCSTDCVKIPSLEELIDACGSHFSNLIYGYLSGTFRAYGFSDLTEGRDDEVCSDWCKTPTEAVARLWLELNK